MTGTCSNKLNTSILYGSFVYVSGGKAERDDHGNQLRFSLYVPTDPHVITTYQLAAHSFQTTEFPGEVYRQGG